jgi:hypothetical protein
MKGGNPRLNLITEIVRIGSGAAFGAATGGGNTIIPFAAGGLAIYLNLLHPVRHIRALVRCGVMGTCWLYKYCQKRYLKNVRESDKKTF